MKEMRCIPSCTYNKYIVREWYDSNFDMLAYQFGDDQRDGANFEVSTTLSQQKLLINIDKICKQYHIVYINSIFSKLSSLRHQMWKSSISFL